jgi:hypothetical protein
MQQALAIEERSQRTLPIFDATVCAITTRASMHCVALRRSGGVSSAALVNCFH